MSVVSRFGQLTMAAVLAVVALPLSAQEGARHTEAGNGSGALQFVTVMPCRLVDTRTNGGPITGGTFRTFNITQEDCGIPVSAAAFSLNVTVIPQGELGYLTIWPTGQPQPVVSLMNSDGRVKANAAVVAAGTDGGVNVYVSNTTNVILDINGYFDTPASSTLAFFTLPPCRVADTRGPDGYLGGPSLQGGHIRDFPILDATACNIPDTAQAYSLNFTAIPTGGAPLQYLTAWPAGDQLPMTSTLNAPTGTIVANAALIPAGVGGDIQVYPTADTDLLIDINGYFAPADSGSDPLSLYPVTPCRVLDTRSGGGAFNGGIVVNVEGSSCAPPGSAQAYVLNATVIPQGELLYLTLSPQGASLPDVSTLNAIDGAITSNMAVVGTMNGFIDAYAQGETNLILDISSYFAP